MKICLRFARHLKRTEQGITNAGGFATTIFRAGTHDELIDDFLLEEDEEARRAAEPVKLYSFDEAIAELTPFKGIEISRADLNMMIESIPVTEETRVQLFAHFGDEEAQAVLAQQSNGNGTKKKQRRTRGTGKKGAAVIAQAQNNGSTQSHP